MKRMPASLAGCIAAGLCCTAALTTLSGEDSSFKDSQKGKETDNAERIHELQESIMVAKAEAEYFRQQWMDLRLRNEALGLDALTGDEKAMHEKLVLALGELYQSEKRRQAVEEALKNLMVAGDNLQKADISEKVAKLEAYEVAVRQAQAVLQGGELVTMKTASDLNTISVVSLDEALGIVIVNAGKVQAVKVGMPFYLLREDQVIGRCRIVEVREYLSAALVEGLQKGKRPKVGDRLLLAATKE